jgi:hypothetical protein
VKKKKVEKRNKIQQVTEQLKQENSIKSKDI